MADEKTQPAGDTAAENTDKTPAPGDTGDKGQHMIPKARLDQEITERRAAEEQLDAVAKELTDDVPEEYRDLVPAGLSAGDRIRWIRAATSRGLFTVAEPLPTDQSKPRITKTAPSPDSLSPAQKMALGYGRSKA